MTGMGQAPRADNPIIVSAFHHALLEQFLAILLLATLVAVAWNAVRTVQYRRLVRAGGTAPVSGPSPGSAIEAAGRRVLRFGFGLLWLVDGILQLQVEMPLGLPTNVLQPAGAGTPGWVARLNAIGVSIWQRHPIPAATSVVWIQIGIGIMLFVAPRGRWTQAAGLASAAWGLIVWVFGEAFGGLFSPGPSWLFGLPGAAVLYIVAGLLLALPERSWATPRFGRRILFGAGIYFIGMAVLQAWPGRGFWQGHLAGHALGPLAQMAGQMATTSQPAAISSAIAAFGHFDAAHGFLVNLIVVIALAGSGAALVSGRRPLVLGGVLALGTLSLATWLLVQDLGVFGGTGTDPNSMVPTLLVVVSGYLAWVRVPAEVAQRAEAPTLDGRPAPWWAVVTARSLTRIGLGVLAGAVVMVGALPMAVTALRAGADPIVAEATDGTPALLDLHAPGFSLVDQHGRTVTLSSLRGKVVALTFLDPVCTTDCPLIAQEFRVADQMLGVSGRKVEFVAVVANPLYNSVSTVDAFDQEEGLVKVPNWLYLTGSFDALRQVWDDYGIQVATEPAGAMVDHSEVAYVIDPAGMERVVLDSDAPDGSVGHQSFSALLSQQIRSFVPR
jgi:cytochrome oxidase Cu insertion factor (SCO1/SenC/PrrC family)